MENEEEIGAKFVATYYRLIYRCPSAIPYLYDTHAILRRDPPKTNFQLCLLQHEIIPFKPNESIVKIFRHVAYSVGDSLIVSVYGSFTNPMETKMFHQQFMLKKNGPKWLIFNDNFYVFRMQTDLYAVVEDQPQAPSFNPIPQSNVSAPIPSPIKRTSSTPTRNRAENLDNERSITIMNLSNNYNGNDIVNAYKIFGNITSKYFTFNTIYLEFETEEEAYNAANSRLPPGMPTNGHIKVEQGIIQKEPRNYIPRK